MTPLQTFTALQEKLPDIFTVKDNAFFCEELELLAFDPETGDIIKASQDGYDWLFEKIEMEYEVVKSNLFDPEGDARIEVERGAEWYVRWWHSLAKGEFCPYHITGATYRTKLECLNTDVPVIIEQYLNPKGGT